jgi:transposase
MNVYYIGADVHNNSTELAIENNCKIIARYSVPTAIPAISNVLASLQGKKYLAVEEGPMAGWLYRNLHTKVEEFIAADPRRNKLISSDGDSDDRIDAAKLAALLRGNYLKAVYHSEDEKRSELKHWVNLYHDRVRNAVCNINKIRARCRMHGIQIPRNVLRDPVHRIQWLSKIKNPVLAKQLNMLWIGYDATVTQTEFARKQLVQLSKIYPIINFWRELPGIGFIRAATLFAFIDTPWRFKKKSKLWKYCGVGLQRTASGTDKKGRPKPAKLQLPWAVNGTLKDAVLGAALSAIRQRQNPFRTDYERMVRNDIIPSNARHAVARKMLTVMWGMWKSNSRFDESLLCSEQNQTTVSYLKS